jgi:uncharacterized protein
VLTADLVNARRKGDELKLVAFDDKARARAIELARELIATVALHEGGTRDELEEALSSIDAAPREQRLRDGLAKLLLDRCEFGDNEEIDAQAIRSLVFTRAAFLRAALPPGGRFDRALVLQEVALQRSMTPEAVDRALFADLRGAHLLIRVATPEPLVLVSSYERGQTQAVLLRAVKVTVDLASTSAGSLRALFRRLKFLRLLHTISKTETGHRIVIDGPYSMFESITKYGLQLALVLPALEQCDAWKLTAEVRWGKERTPLLFRCHGELPESREKAVDPGVPSEITTLIKSFRGLGTAWRVSTNTRILDLPGVGLSVPDLVFERGGEGWPTERIYFEVMGYWSRAAVWSRVELVQAGLKERVLFAVSSRLRVSEEALGDDLPSAIYVYKGTLSARVVQERLEELTSRARDLPL